MSPSKLSLGGPSQEAPKVKALLILGESDVRHLLRQTLESVDAMEVIAETDSLVYGYELLRQNKPQLALIELGNRPEQTLEWITKISTYQPHTLVTLVGPEPSKELLQEAMAAGARRWLNTPVNPDELLTLLSEHENELLLDSSRSEESGRLMTVFSKKGGLGKTSIAVNLAFALSEVTEQSVVLVDLNMQLGDVTTFLDIEPRQTITSLAENLARADKEYLQNALSRYKTDRASIYVLSESPDSEEEEELDATEVNKVLTVLKSSFDYVIVDAAAAFENKTLIALDLSDNILLTSIINLPCIRSTQQVLSLFDRLDYDQQKIKLLINRYVPGEEITIDDVEMALNRSVFWKIPNDYRTVMQAMNQGVPICEFNPNTPIWEYFKELAYRLSGRIRPKEQLPSLSQQSLSKSNPLFRLFNRS